MSTADSQDPKDHGDAALCIDLAAVVSNYRWLAAQAKPARTAAVVKADAYGTGVAQVAPALARAGAERFFVAQASEAVQLRAILGQSWSDAQIFVFGGVQDGQEQTFLDWNLTPVLNSLEQILRWQRCGFDTGPLAAAIHIDTGMNRLGLSSGDVRRIGEDRSALDGIDPILVMSHLACADTPSHPMNRAQLADFRDLSQIFPGVPRSLANSSGIVLGADYHFDWVRPGLGLYGGNPVPGQKNPLSRVVEVTAPVLQVRTVRPGESVGYGASFRPDLTRRIATVSAGYADGLARALAGAGAVFIRGRSAPIVGRLSMDLIGVDITDIPEPAIKAGDRVEILGDHISVDDLAAAAGTISYEILTSLGHRYLRHYRGSQGTP